MSGGLYGYGGDIIAHYYKWQVLFKLWVWAVTSKLNTYMICDFAFIFCHFFIIQLHVLSFFFFERLILSIIMFNDLLIKIIFYKQTEKHDLLWETIIVGRWERQTRQELDLMGYTRLLRHLLSSTNKRD